MNGLKKVVKRMCRGLAVIMDKKGRIHCKGLSSHIDTCESLRLRGDDCLKFEVVVTDKNKSGYKVTVDEDYEKNSEQGREAKALLPTVKKWVKDNEVQVLRWLLFNQSYAEHKEDADVDFWIVGGNANASYWKVKKGVLAAGWKVKENADIGSWEVGGYASVISWKVKKNVYIYSWEVEGSVYAHSWEVGRNADISHWKVGGKLKVSMVQTGLNKNTYKAENEFIKSLGSRLCWHQLVRMAMHCPKEKMEEIMRGDE